MWGYFISNRYGFSSDVHKIPEQWDNQTQYRYTWRLGCASKHVLFKIIPAVLASVGNQVDLHSLNNVVNRWKPIDPITLQKKHIHTWVVGLLPGCPHSLHDYIKCWQLHMWYHRWNDPSPCPSLSSQRPLKIGSPRCGNCVAASRPACQIWQNGEIM